MAKLEFDQACKCIIQGPLKLIDNGYHKLGEAFTVPVLHKKITFLIGPDVAPHFYKATDMDMSQEEVLNFRAFPPQSSAYCCLRIYSVLHHCRA